MIAIASILQTMIKTASRVDERVIARATGSQRVSRAEIKPLQAAQFGGAVRVAQRVGKSLQFRPGRVRASGGSGRGSRNADRGRDRRPGDRPPRNRWRCSARARWFGIGGRKRSASPVVWMHYCVLLFIPVALRGCASGGCRSLVAAGADRLRPGSPGLREHRLRAVARSGSPDRRRPGTGRAAASSCGRLRRRGSAPRSRMGRSPESRSAEHRSRPSQDPPPTAARA